MDKLTTVLTRAIFELKRSKSEYFPHIEKLNEMANRFSPEGSHPNDKMWSSHKIDVYQADLKWFHKVYLKHIYHVRVLIKCTKPSRPQKRLICEFNHLVKEIFDEYYKMVIGHADNRIYPGRESFVDLASSVYHTYHCTRPSRINFKRISSREEDDLDDEDELEYAY